LNFFFEFEFLFIIILLFIYFNIIQQLSNDATLVKSATGERLGTIFQIFATIIGGLGIALTACWQVTSHFISFFFQHLFVNF